MIQTILGLGAGVIFLFILIWLLPIVLILKSRKTSGAEKLFWLVAVLFVSWFAWILYMFLAPISDRQ